MTTRELRDISFFFFIGRIPPNQLVTSLPGVTFSSLLSVYCLSSKKKWISK